MARLRSVGGFVTFATWTVFVLQVAAQSDGGATVIATASPTPSTASPTGTITSATSANSASVTASSSNDVPLSLWGVANSLISSYYPSTSVTNPGTLTWPTAVVIDSSTYSVHPSSTDAPTTSLLAEATGAASNKSHSMSSDKKLGIAIGVSIGAVAVIVLGIVLCCMHRRRKATGAFFNRRPTPSVSDSDLESWRSPPQRHASAFMQVGPSRGHGWSEKYDSLQRGPAAGPEPGGAFGALQPPPMAMHPAYTRQHSNYSSSEDNPFFTPEERSQQYDSAEEGAVGHSELAADARSERHSSDTMRHGSRPATPFSPMMMMAGGAGPSHHQERHNPFASPEDDYEEERDLVSPIIPARSPERRHSPMVHYPSWSEVSEFDFDGNGRRSVRGQPSYEDGEDGWRPIRDSVYGRHELA